jgi:hypothetical protein
LTPAPTIVTPLTLSVSSLSLKCVFTQSVPRLHEESIVS